MEKKNSPFRLADKMGYKTPFNDSPFRTDWAEKREKEREERLEAEQLAKAVREAQYKEKRNPTLNDTELAFVKFLFKIRNANYYAKTGQGSSMIPYEYISGPIGMYQRERVFIAGKIFPMLNLTYSGKNADASRIELRTIDPKV